MPSSSHDDVYMDFSSLQLFASPNTKNFHCSVENTFAIETIKNVVVLILCVCVGVYFDYTIFMKNIHRDVEE